MLLAAVVVPARLINPVYVAADWHFRELSQQYPRGARMHHHQQRVRPDCTLLYVSLVFLYRHPSAPPGAASTPRRLARHLDQ